MSGLWLPLQENILIEFIGMRIFILPVDGTTPSARDPELYIMEKVSKVLIYIHQNYTLQMFFLHSVCPPFILLVFNLWGMFLTRHNQICLVLASVSYAFRIISRKSLYIWIPSVVSSMLFAHCFHSFVFWVFNHFEFMLSDCGFVLLHIDIQCLQQHLLRNQSVCALSNLIISDHESPLLLCSIWESVLRAWGIS